jgi:outer membrane protein OmpA-like peptidoglycan-associated protein
MKRLGALVVCIAVLGALADGCAEAPKLEGKIAGLEKIAEQAERNGAIRCAPRELAIAKSELEFAKIEMAQGSLSRAKDHVFIAEPNANAATFLSPPQYCAARQFVEPGDRDGDGYADPDDSCPDEPENFQGFKDEDGCPDDPDTDGDGVPDSADQCVLDPEDADKYLDEDGCPDIDNDLDGVLDTTDKCPNEAEDPDGYEDEDGCPDPDNDKDQVPDVKDQCPNEAGSSTQEPLGCPTKSLVVVTDCEVKITQQIHFEFNKARIRPESFPVLDAVVDALNKNPDIRIEVQGHTDNIGGAAYNKRLSDQRSASVRQYLTAHGITSSRLTSHGYGFDRPLVPNDTDHNRALNRRVQFVRTEGAKEGCPPTSK